MSLVRAERRRLHKRRFTKYMLVIGVLLLAAVAVGLWFTHQKITPEVRAAAQAQAEAQYQQQLQMWNDHDKTECVAAAKEKGGPADEMCQGPTRDMFQAEWFLPATYDFKKDAVEMAIVWAGIMSMVAFVVGASFVGAEWSSGGMMNLLLWRPKRIGVLGTKLAVLLGSLTFWSLLAGGLFTGAQWLVGMYRGTTDGMTAGAWRSYGLIELRGLAIILAVGAIGFAVASLGRHTAMALGLAVGFVVVLQIGLRIVLELAQAHFADRYMVTTYIAAWMKKSVLLQDYNACRFSNGECNPAEMTITWQQTGKFAAPALALLLVTAFWSIRRRDAA